VRMKFLVKRKGRSWEFLILGSAFWNNWNPQYFLSEDDVDEKRDSVIIGFEERSESIEGVDLPSTTKLQKSWREPLEGAFSF